MPEINHQDDDKLIIIEKCIDYKIYNDWDENDFSLVMTDVLERTIEYLRTVVQKGDYYLKSPAAIIENIDKKDDLLKYICNGINKNIKNIKFPFIKLHGDLWTSNLLIDMKDNTIKYIDFEHSKNFVFFYDVLFIFWGESWLYNTHKLTYEFLIGTYDNYFIDIYKLLDLEFDEKCKIDYLNIFFLDQYNARWLNVNENGKQNILQKYKEFMNYVRSIKN